MIQKSTGIFIYHVMFAEKKSLVKIGGEILDFVDTLAYAKSNDWTFQHSQDGWKHICPVCSIMSDFK